MSWIAVLGSVVAIIVLVALSGIRLKGTRPAGSTHLMTAARICLGIFLLILILVALKVL